MYPIDLAHLNRGTNLRLVADGVYVGGNDANVPGVSVIQLAPQNPPLTGRVNVLRRPISDGVPVSPQLLAEVVDFACRVQPPILVQCYAGLSRSASIAYAIMRACMGVDAAEALRRVSGQTRDGSRWPHPNVIASVREWERMRGI